MLERKQFKNFVNIIMSLDERDLKLTKALQEFSGDIDFTGFRDSVQDRLLDWLVETMHDSEIDPVMLWWLYDAPDAGKEPENCILTEEYSDGEVKEYKILNLDDLYDYLKEHYDD